VNRFIGVDFSGAKDAGRKIWIAEGRAAGGATFEIERLFQATELSNGDPAPLVCIPALARYIAKQGAAVIGCDFPFGLPRALAFARTWRSFAIRYRQRYSDPDAFRGRLMTHTGQREFKRQTDRIAGTPFNSYNLRLYRQTWWGIAGLLAPLVESKKISVRPQQRPLTGKPQVIEVCAACTLKSIAFYPSYKGIGEARRASRKEIMRELISRGCLAPPSRSMRRLMIEDKEGDALDAVIGALAAMRADLSAEPDEQEKIEGRVYFAV
jgi:hypothetical protein